MDQRVFHRKPGEVFFGHYVLGCCERQRARILPGDSAWQGLNDVPFNFEVISGSGAVNPRSFTAAVPVVLVHGISGSPDSFGNMKILLEGDGINVAVPFDYSGKTNIVTDAFWSIERIAKGLATHICEVVKGGRLDEVRGQSSKRGAVDIVAHSMGGLVTRAYMAGLARAGLASVPYHNSKKIRKLILV